MDNKQQPSGFKDLLTSLMQKRWYVTAIVLGIFVLILLGLFVAVAIGIEIPAGLREILLLLVGVFSGSYNKIIDYYYSDADKDKLLVQKMDEEDGVSLSHANDMKETNKPFAPAIPDAFVAGAQAARELAVVENKQKYDLNKDEQEHRQAMEVDKQEHDQEMEKLEFEFHAHRQCQHEWGDADNDGELECQICGLLKDKA
jgi:hypothetical protein